MSVSELIISNNLKIDNLLVENLLEAGMFAASSTLLGTGELSQVVSYALTRTTCMRVIQFLCVREGIQRGSHATEYKNPIMQRLGPLIGSQLGTLVGKPISCIAGVLSGAMLSSLSLGPVLTSEAVRFLTDRVVSLF